MDSPETGLSGFGERVQGALEAETQPSDQIRAARTRLLERVTRVRGSTRSAMAGRLRLAALGGAAALAAALLVLRWWQPITFATPAGRRAIGDELEGVRHQPLPVDFSEGSRILLREGSRARVLDAAHSGARVLLESGVAEISIVHRVGRTTSWRFEAGPFQVWVKGTQFELGWDPDVQSFSLAMKTGSVELSGSCLPAPRIVGRGQTLRLSCAEAVPQRAPAVAARDARETAPARPEPAQPRKPSAPPAGPKPATRETNAPPPGFEARCETASKAELVAWANRERLEGSVARARAALLALRRRFPGTSEAGTAAFTLGRIAFDRRGDYADAARWFAAYLAEQPNGPLMGDATGRLLEAHDRQGDRVAARHAAEAYLQRFPDGPYASRARRILAE